MKFSAWRNNMNVLFVGSKPQGLKTLVTLDDVQFYLAQGVHVHPALYAEFIARLNNPQCSDKICPMPVARLQNFSFKYTSQKLKKAV